MTTDKERIDWLELNNTCVSIRKIYRQPYFGYGRDKDTEAYREGMRVELFTIASQHVYGTNVCDAIDKAMKVVRRGAL